MGSLPRGPTLLAPALSGGVAAVGWFWKVLMVAWWIGHVPDD